RHRPAAARGGARVRRHLLIVALLLPAALARGETPLPPGERLLLQDGWMIASSAEARQGGAALSTPGAAVTGRIPARVPPTVPAARVAHGDFPDPGHGTNLRRIPGSGEHAIGEDFSGFDMPPT